MEFYPNNLDKKSTDIVNIFYKEDYKKFKATSNGSARMRAQPSSYLACLFRLRRISF